MHFATLKQSQLISYYNYTSEVHTVTTEQGYVLTLVRCNSKNSCARHKKVVVMQHGFLGSSDDFTMNPPKHGLGENEN